MQLLCLPSHSDRHAGVMKLQGPARRLFSTTRTDACAESDASAKLGDGVAAADCRAIRGKMPLLVLWLAKPGPSDYDARNQAEVCLAQRFTSIVMWQYRPSRQAACARTST